ncbi:MAG TPA: hypothetical protein VKQ52_07205, partial [Puia sp.]|nr:hypothetical protein [Puia sp.]
MSKLFILLAGTLLLSHSNFITSPFIRSSVELRSPAAPAGNKEPDLERCCKKILKAGPRIFYLGDRSGRMRFRLLGIYAHGPALFFLLRLNNRSALDYD